MSKRWGLFLFLPALMAFAPRQEPDEKFVKYMGERGWIYVRNFETLNATRSGEIRIQGKGRPIQIQDTGNGLTITGNDVDVTLAPGPLGMRLERATVSEKARAIFDSDLLYRTGVEMATAQRPAPAKPAETSKATMASETMVFTREGNIGTLTMPTAASMVIDTKGTQITPATSTTTEYNQNLDVQGSKAVFTVGISPSEDFNAPQKGRIEGPVTMHLVRTEKASNQTAPEKTDLTGTTDLVELDFTVPQPTLAFTGNVHVQGQAKGMPGEVRGTKGTLVMNRSFEIVSYQFTGNPTETRLKVKDGSR